MSLLRRAVRRDSSEKAIVEALRANGWTVAYISGRDVPDILAGRGGVTEVIEVKTGKGKLKPGQEAFHREWRGKPVRVLRTVEDVAALNAEWAGLALHAEGPR